MNVFVILLLCCEALFSLYLIKRSKTCQCKKAFFFILFAFFLRGLSLNHISADYTIFLSNWMEQIRANGGFASLAKSIGNYTLPYMTVLALFSYSDIGDLYLIKLFSIFFDVVLAWSVMKIVQKFTNDDKRALLSFCLVLLLPTVIINSSFWGQCDSIYVAMGILGIYLALDDRPILSVICIAVSFSFKLQAVFIMPIYAVLWMQKKIKWWHFLFFPLTYIILIMPAVIAGRPFGEALLLYTTQTGSIGNGYSYTTASFLSIIQAGQTALAALNTPDAVEKISKLFVLIALLFVLIVLAFCYINRKSINNLLIIMTAVLFAMGIPYLLPHMHDRYFYYADIITLALAMIRKKYWPFAIITEIVSLLCYWAYYSSLINTPFLPVYIGALILGVTIAVYIIYYLKAFCDERSTETNLG